MRGRKPEPTESRRLRGNPGKRAMNEQEPNHPTVADAFDEPPAELRDDQAASDEWRRLAPRLRMSRTVTDVDRGALLSVCQQWSTYLEARSKVTSLVITTKSGHPMPNPYLGVANKALGLCVKLWAELGCTPSSRSRVKTAGESVAGDPLEQALSDHATTH